MRHKRRSFLFAGLTALLVVAACSGQKPAAGKGARYLTEKVAMGDVEKTVLATGALQPSEVVNVGAQASGQIQSLEIKVGDRVHRGQVLAVIDPATQQTTLRNAEAQLAVQQAQRASQEASLAQNELTLRRQETLLKTNATSQSAYDQADLAVKLSRANIRSSDAQIRQAETNVEKARVDLGRTNVTAPIDGVVTAIVVRQGQTVNAVQSAPTIVRIANMDLMTVKAQVSEADVINVRPGQKVYFTILGDPEKRYYGQLSGVEPAPESAQGANEMAASAASSTSAVYYNALFDVPNTDGRLRASMTAQVNIVLDEIKGVVTVAAGALSATPDAQGRYTVKILGADGKTTERKVRVGLNNNVTAQVLEGLKVGDNVVIGDGRGITANAMTGGGPPPKR